MLLENMYEKFPSPTKVFFLPHQSPRGKQTPVILLFNKELDIFIFAMGNIFKQRKRNINACIIYQCVVTNTMSTIFCCIEKPHCPLIKL